MIGAGVATAAGMALASLGFLADRHRYRCGDVLLSTGSLWWSLTAPVPADHPGHQEDWLTRIGPWRLTPDGGQSCDLPAGPLLEASGGDDEGEDIALQALRWALETRGGDGSELPTRHVVTSCHEDRLTARIGPFACTGQVVATEGRLWVDFPVGEVPPDLPESRQRWVDSLVAATDRLAMVRVGFATGAADGERTVHVRADLSGAPAAVVEALLPALTDVARAAAIWMLPGLEVLTDATVSSRALRLGAVAKP